MRIRFYAIVVCLALIASACGAKPGTPSTASPAPQQTLGPERAAYPASQETITPGGQAAATGTAYPGPQETARTPTSQIELSTAYPPPQDTVTPSSGGTAYPPPQATQYPGPQDTLPPAQTRQASPTVSPTPGMTATPGFELTATPEITSTQSLTPTERPISTAMPPPGSIAQTIRIWHSWGAGEASILDFVLQNFQDFYPDVAFDVTYVPEDELYGRYEMETYRGGGPSVLFGPAEWGPTLYQKGLVADLKRDADPKFLAEINPAALGEARFHGALIGLPSSIRGGVVLYRNITLLPTPPATFEELVRLARLATHGGKVGAYLERGLLYSAAHLYGLGGSLLNDQGQPAFNTSQGLAWLELLRSFDQAGATDFNSDRDLDLFKLGKAGLIIDWSWKRDELAKAIGKENLVIDAWPASPGGRLSGFVQADNLYLNANLHGDERYSALLFMGFMMSRQVQSVLARAGHIPAVLNVTVEDPLMRQAMKAFEGGTPYPIDPVLMDYFDPLEAAMQAVFEGKASPEAALQKAYDEILEKLK